MMKQKKLRPIILAGGSGTRLWPLSTKEKPKQFIPLFGEYSLFDLTLQRLNKDSLFKKPIVVSSKQYIEYIHDSMERTGVELELIILEPQAKNTFPAITLAVKMAMMNNEDETFFIAPSDHYISKNKEFHDTCKVALEKSEENCLVLFGIRTESPSSEYGYIVSKSHEEEVNKVKKFVEKPDFDKAKNLLNKHNALWNSGMFIFNGPWFLDTCQEIKLEDLNKISNILPKYYPKNLEFYLPKDKFSKLNSTSFDKAFVEKINKSYVTVLNAGWSDLGSWISLSALWSDPNSKMTIFSGIDHSRVNKPWGFFEVLMETDVSKVKFISVLPEQKLSLQKHQYRSETWYVISGKAKVTKGNERFTMLSGDSVIINQNEEHRLENVSEQPLEIIEIQSGTYFGEDDIVRIKDSYGRAGLH